MSATLLQSCAYKSVFTSDNGQQQVLRKISPPPWTEALVTLLVALVLFFSEFTRKPSDPENLDFHEVASRLMPTSHEPYRAPLRLVTFRKPIISPHSHPDHREDIRLAGVLVRETLECGHKLTVYPGEWEPLIAKRRRCKECLNVVELPLPKKPNQSVREVPRKEESA